MGIKEILANKEDVIVGNGNSDEIVSKAEEELGSLFALEYKEYLIAMGLAMCNGHELTGLGNIERLNVVSVTKHFKELDPDIPKDWYVIENTNMDGLIVWQDKDSYVYYNRRKEFDSLSDFLQAI